MSHGYTILPAEREHLAALPRIELVAARLLAPYAPRHVLDETTDEETFRQAQRQGKLWIAAAGDGPIGFALVEMLADGHSHLEEMDVLPCRARRGVETALHAKVPECSRHSRHIETTLTTFRAPPWNMPFYLRARFEEIGPEEWSAEVKGVVAAEASRGLWNQGRCVMRYSHR